MSFECKSIYSENSGSNRMVELINYRSVGITVSKKYLKKKFKYKFHVKSCTKFLNFLLFFENLFRLAILLDTFK